MANRPGTSERRKAYSIVAGKPAYSLKGYRELCDLVAEIATKKNLTMPEVLDRYALANLRRAVAAMRAES